MKKLEKLLQKLDAKTRRRIETALAQILSGNIKNLNVKKIRGSDNVFRARVGSHRIIFIQSKSEIRLIDIQKRDEKTYKDL